MSARHVGRRATIPSGGKSSRELDDELLSLCREYHANNGEFRRLTAIWAELDSRSAAAIEIDGKFAVLVKRLSELRGAIFDQAARTPEGLRAKAAVVLVDLSEDSSGTMEPRDHQYLTAWSLARDVLERAV